MSIHFPTSLHNYSHPSQTSSGSETVATVTGYAHPLKLTPLETLAASQTALSYATPPSAIPVPEAPPAAAVLAVAAGEGEDSTPSAVQQEEEAATSVCTSITGSSPTATLPSFCEPSLHVNAPEFLTPRNESLALANVTIGTAADKIACCVECVRLFNCVAWRFNPVYVGEPTERLPGGFDPWGRGSCDVVYYTGGIDPENGVTEDGAADLCPNGKVGEVLEGSANVPGPDGNSTDRWTNVYYNGWNQGSCGAPVNVFESGTNAGKGDPDTLCE